MDDYYVRIIGQVNQTSWRTEVDIDATPAVDYNGNKGSGLLLPKDVTNKESFSINAYNNDVFNPYAYWEDLDVYASNRMYKDENYKQINYLKYKYIVYPFHRQYLNNYTKDITIDIDVRNSKDPEVTVKASSDIKNKIFSTNRVFGSTTLYDNVDVSESSGPAYAKIFNYISESPIKVKSSNNTYINYNANINDISEPFRNSIINTDVYEYEGLFDEASIVFKGLVSDDSVVNIYSKDPTTYTIEYERYAGGPTGRCTVYDNRDKTVLGSSNTQTTKVLANYKGSYPVLATRFKLPSNSGYLDNDIRFISFFIFSRTL